MRARERVLVDMRGEVVHRWLVPGIDARWQHVEMTPEGELLVIVNVNDDHFLMSLDWNSNVLWKRSLAAHHDIAVTGTGEIHTLTSRVIEIPFGEHQIPIIDNSIVAFSSAIGGDPRGLALRTLRRSNPPAEIREGARSDASASKPDPTPVRKRSS